MPAPEKEAEGGGERVFHAETQRRGGGCTQMALQFGKRSVMNHGMDWPPVVNAGKFWDRFLQEFDKI